MAGQFNIPGGVDLDVLKQVYNKLSGTNKYDTVKSVKEPKAILGEAIENFVKKQVPETKAPSISKPVKQVDSRTINEILEAWSKNADKGYAKVADIFGKGKGVFGPVSKTAGSIMNVAGKYALPIQLLETAYSTLSNKPKDEKIASGLSLLGTAGAAVGKAPQVAIPSALLAVGAGTYPMWKGNVQDVLAELEANKQASKAAKPKDSVNSNGIDLEVIDGPLPQSDGTNMIDVLPPKTGLTGAGVNVNNNLQPIPQQAAQAGGVQTQQQVPQQFIYETPAAKNEVLDFMEKFARQYPAMQEQDRRRQMQAALLAPVIQNDKFVDAALGQGQVATTAKQLELLNTAANARVSEAQRPLLAQAFAKAGMPAELAYASEDQLKSIANVLVTDINRESARYKADMAAKLGVYKANTQLEGVRIATAAKQGPEKLIQVMGQAGYPMDEIEAMLEKVWGPYWKNMIGTGAPIQFNLGTGQVQGPEEPDFFNNN